MEDAWRWYNDVKRSLKCMHRLGVRYWDVIPWDQPPWRSDNQLGVLEKEEVTEPAKNGLRNLDDLAIVVLFSVFEAIVRGVRLEQIEQEEAQFVPQVLANAIQTEKERVAEGSFFHVLESDQGTENNLKEEVNQVRKYRNWVAHGKRGEQPPFVAPNAAYDRLTRFLAVLFAPPVITDDWIALLRETGD